MTYCIFVTGALFGVLRDGMDGETIFMFVVLYLGAVLIYCLYELLTTKKWRNLLSALPLLGVVAVLNVGILLGMHMVSNKIVNNRPLCRRSRAFPFRIMRGMRSATDKAPKWTTITM